MCRTATRYIQVKRRKRFIALKPDQVEELLKSAPENLNHRFHDEVLGLHRVLPLVPLRKVANITFHQIQQEQNQKKVHAVIHLPSSRNPLSLESEKQKNLWYKQYVDVIETVSSKAVFPTGISSSFVNCDYMFFFFFWEYFVFLLFSLYLRNEFNIVLNVLFSSFGYGFINIKL